MKLKSLTARLAALLCACGFAFSAWADAGAALTPSGTTITPAAFKTAVDGVATYDGQGVTVDFSEESGDNNHSDGKQFYVLGGYDPMRSQPITVRNVKFYSSSDKAQLYLYTKANVTFENCVFENVGVSMHGVAYDSKATTLGTFTNCTFKDFDEYAIKYVYNVVVSGCRFDNCERALLIGYQPKAPETPVEVSKVIIDGCEFSNLKAKRIVKFYDIEPVWNDNTVMSITNNRVEGSCTAGFIQIEYDTVNGGDSLSAEDYTYKFYFVGNTGITQDKVNDAANTKKTLYIDGDYLVDVEPVAVTYVAQIGETKYETLAAAINAAQSGDTVKLLTDVTVSEYVGITNSITLDGDNHILTVNATRGIRVSSGDVSVTIKNLTIPVTSGLERAIQVDSDKDNVALTIDNVTAEATYYTVNICAGVDDLVLKIKSSNLTGYGVANLWGNGNNGSVEIDSSTLTGVNTASYSAWNKFGVIIAEGDTTGQTDLHATAYTITVKDTTIVSTSTYGNKQSAVLFNAQSVGNTVVLDGCTITRGNENCTFFLDNGSANTTKVRNTKDSTTNELPALPDGYCYTAPDADSYRTIAKAVAEVAGEYYVTLAEAVAATHEGTINLIRDASGAGIFIGANAGKSITIDFGGYTYTVVGPAVGSKGTESQAFHLEKGNSVTLKNGTVTATTDSGVLMLVQNYCDLTLDDIVLDGSENSNISYVVSNNNGSMTATGSTCILAAEGKVAFDVCATSYYPEGVTVTFDSNFEGFVEGKVEYDVWGSIPANNKATLTIEEGNDGWFVIDWQVEEALAQAAKSNFNIAGGTFTTDVPADYCADGFIPTSFVDEDDGETYYAVRPANYVAQIGDTQYETLQAAFNAVADGETITLLTDVTQDDGIMFNHEGVSAKLNLNENTLTVNTGSNINNRAIKIEKGTLEVYNGTIVAVGAGTTSSNGTGCYGAFRVEANGVLNAHDLSLSNARPWGLNVKVLGGEATLTRVTITSSYGGGIEVTEANLGTHSKAGTATLTDCTFTQTGYYDHCSTCLSVSGGSELTINSGSYTSDNYALYVFSSGGVINVNGGTFSGNKGGVAIIAAIDTATYPQYVGGLSIAGGDFTGGYSITSPAYMTVTGGRYSVDPAAYVAANYSTALVDGKYVIVDAVAKIGNKYYATLDAAYDAAAEGDTIQLLADITYGTDKSVPVWGKAVNLDLGGFTLETKSGVGKDLSNMGYTAAAVCYSIPISGPATGTVKYVTVSNGTIITAYGAGVYADGADLELTLTNLTVRSATVGTQSTKEYSSAVRITSNAKVIIESGSYSGPNAIAVSCSGGRYEIKDGKFFGDLFISTSTGVEQTIAISGGYFSTKVPAGYCATGYVPTTRQAANGLYTVTTPATVTYTLDSDAPQGATAPDQFTYPSGDLAEIALANPTYTSDDYTFGGWQMTVGDKTKVVSALPAGTEDDVTLVATWKPVTKIQIDIAVPTQEQPTAKETVEIKVTDDWVADNVTVDQGATDEEKAAAIVDALNTKQDNDLTGLENYLLGLDGNDPDAKVKVESEQGASETAMPVKNTLTEKVQTADTGFTVKYSLDKVDEAGETVDGGAGEKQDTSDLALDLTTVGSEPTYYKMTATITKTVTSGNETTDVEVSKVKSENTIGVLKVESAAKTTVIGVPWTSLEKDESISVNDLVRTSTLSEGDQIQVYDKDANGYRSWTIQDGKWTADTVIGSTAGTGAANAVKVDRGKGVLLTRSDTTKPIYLVGSADKQSESVSTTVDAAETTSKPAWNLVASPKPVEVDVSTVAAQADTVIVPTDTAPRNYTYKDGVWGYDGLDSETITNKLGIIIVKPKRVTGDLKIPAGKGFWYLNKGTSDKTINW